MSSMLKKLEVIPCKHENQNSFIVNIPSCLNNSGKSLGLTFAEFYASGRGLTVVSVSKDVIHELKDISPYEYRIKSFNDIAIDSMPTAKAKSLLKTDNSFPLRLQFCEAKYLFTLRINSYFKKTSVFGLTFKNGYGKTKLSEMQWQKKDLPLDFPSFKSGEHYVVEINGVNTRDLSFKKVVELMKRSKVPVDLLIEYTAADINATNRIGRDPLNSRNNFITFDNTNPMREPEIRKRNISESEIIKIDLLDSDVEDMSEAPKKIKKTLSGAASVPTFVKGAIVRTPFGIGQIKKIIQKYKRQKIYHEVLVNGIAAYILPEHLEDISNEKIYTFSSKKLGTIVLTRGDIGRLEEGEFLNDNLVDFYFSYLQDHILTPEINSQIHIFSTFFFTQIDSFVEETEEGRKKISRWTKNVDIFSKKVLIIPVNINLHWSLAVVINPSLVNSESNPVLCDNCQSVLQKEKLLEQQKEVLDINTIKNETQEKDEVIKKKENAASDTNECNCKEDKPCILMLDSMMCHRTQNVLKSIRKYLQIEWEIRNVNEPNKKIFNGKTIPNVTPTKIPRQFNLCDCGVFMLHYAEVLLEKIPKVDAEFIFLKGRNELNEKWFPPSYIQKKRAKIKHLIHQMIPQHILIK